MQSSRGPTTSVSINCVQWTHAAAVSIVKKPCVCCRQRRVGKSACPAESYTQCHDLQTGETKFIQGRVLCGVYVVHGGTQAIHKKLTLSSPENFAW
jgi:hypothetical protein